MFSLAKLVLGRDNYTNISIKNALTSFLTITAVLYLLARFLSLIKKRLERMLFLISFVQFLLVLSQHTFATKENTLFTANLLTFFCYLMIFL